MVSQLRQRTTRPGASTYARASPSAATLPHPSQRPRAAVSSSANTSLSIPAAALPSSSSTVTSPPCRAESLGSDAFGRVPERDECRRDGLDERRRAADEDARIRLRCEPRLAQQVLVDASCT